MFLKKQRNSSRSWTAILFCWMDPAQRISSFFSHCLMTAPFFFFFFFWVGEEVERIGKTFDWIAGVYTAWIPLGVMKRDGRPNLANRPVLSFSLDDQSWCSCLTIQIPSPPQTHQIGAAAGGYQLSLWWTARILSSRSIRFRGWPTTSIYRRDPMNSITQRKKGRLEVRSRAYRCKYIQYLVLPFLIYIHDHLFSGVALDQAH